MNLFVVPLERVNSVWEKAAPFIADAFEKAGSNYTAEHARVLVTQGNWTLVVAVEDGDIKGAGTINFFNRPVERVAFVTSIGGFLITNKDTFNELCDIARSNGATVIEGAAREAVARLWQQYGFTEKHRVVGVNI